MKKLNIVFFLFFLILPISFSNVLFIEDFENLAGIIPEFTYKNLTLNNTKLYLNYENDTYAIKYDGGITYFTGTVFCDYPPCLEHTALGSVPHNIKVFVYKKDNVNILLSGLTYIGLYGSYENSDLNLILYFSDYTQAIFSLQNDFGFDGGLKQQNISIPLIYDNKLIKNISILMNYTGTNTYKQVLDNLIIFDYDNNTLPQANITLNNNLPICMNTTEDYIDIPINITSYDLENDIILYSYLDYTIYNVDKFILYNNRNCQGNNFCFGNSINTEFVNNVIYKTENDTCLIVPFSPFRFSPDYFDLKQFVNSENRNVFMLSLSSFTCNKDDKTFYYKLAEDIYNIYYHTSIYNMLNNTEFNITFYDSFFNPINIFGFFRIKNKLIVKEYNITDTFEIIDTNNLTYTDFLNPIDIFINNNKFKLGNGTNIFIEKNYSMFNNLSVSVIGITIKNNTNIAQDNFLYKGMVKNLTFSEDKITSFRVYSKGDYKILFYITDYPNKDLDKFNIVEKNFKVVSCDSIYNVQYPKDYTNFLRLGGNAYRGFCELNNKIINGFGVNLNACDLYYYIYMAICLIIALSLAGFLLITFGSPYLTFGLSGVVFSLSQVFVYQIFMFSIGFMFLYAFIFAVSMISLVIGLFVTKT